MAPTYKLTYFNLKGLAESIRFLLSYMKEEFEDIRVEMDQWPALKPAFPFGKLPVLEENGKKITQSMAIARYLGKKAGLGGKDAWEDLQIDIMADTIVDMRTPIGQFMREPNEEIKKPKKDTYVKETLPFYLKKFDAVVKENGGFLANKKLSWVDIVFATSIEFLSTVADSKDCTADYPNLHALKQKVFAIPQIKAWISKRPDTPY